MASGRLFERQFGNRIGAPACKRGEFVCRFDPEEARERPADAAEARPGLPLFSERLAPPPTFL
jgi:hypothetical protein